MEIPSLTSPRSKKNLEASFYKKLKTNQKKFRPDLKFTRLESWASQGVPDLVICSENGTFYFVELKTTNGVAVKLSPHQVSWLTQHKHAPTYIFVHTKKAEVFVYAGSQAVELVDRGLLLQPLHHFKAPVNWNEFFKLTLPL